MFIVRSYVTIWNPQDKQSTVAANISLDYEITDCHSVTAALTHFNLEMQMICCTWDEITIPFSMQLDKLDLQSF